MKEQNPRKYSVAGLGEWGIAEGLVYENWEELDFEVDELGIERDGNGKIITDESWQYRSFFGLDYGYTNDPTAFIAFSLNGIKSEPTEAAFISIMTAFSEYSLLKVISA